MKRLGKKSLLMLAVGLCMAFVAVQPAKAALLSSVDSLAYVYHAQEDPDGTTDGMWTASESYHGYAESDLTLNGSPGYNASTGSPYANLSEAFTFSTAAYATQAGSALNTYGAMTREGSTDQDSLTYEMWIKAAAGSTNTSLDGQYLISTGTGNAGRGAYLKFKENGATVDIQFLVRRDGGMATASWTLDSTDANTNGLIDILEDDFVQIVAMYDRDDAVRSANDYVYLSVNAGTPVTDSNITDANAIKFNGQSRFALVNTKPVPNTLPHPGDSDGTSTTTTDTSFAGDIALIRIYDTALTDADVLAAYNSVIPEPATLALLGLGLGGLLLRRRR